MKKFPSCPQLNKPKLTSETLRYMFSQCFFAHKKCHSMNNINKSLSEYVLVKVVEELNFVTLHFLLKLPRSPLEDRVILRVIASLVYYNFITRVMLTTEERTRLAATMTFRTLLHKIPMSKYSLMAEFIVENLW
jgi:uncharacterized membrane protein